MTIPGSMDHRAARSRAAIQAAFLRQIVENGYEEVDVKALCARAGVSRATFYAHFKNKDDLKRKGIDQMRRDLMRSIDGSPNARAFPFMRPLLEHAHSHLALFRALQGTAGE